MDINKEKSKLRAQKYRQIKKFKRSYDDVCNEFSVNSATSKDNHVVNNIKTDNSSEEIYFNDSDLNHTDDIKVEEESSDSNENDSQIDIANEEIYNNITR